MKSLDSIIIGQGLAGSILAWQLIKQGQRVLVIDDQPQDSSSQVAAGIINPVTGLRLVKHPLTDLYLEQAMFCYQELEKKFQTELYYTLPMIRLFTSQQEKENYSKRSQDQNYSPYLGKSFSTADNPDIINPLGGFFQQQTGYVDSPKLLKNLKDYFIQTNSYLKDRVSYESFSFDSKTVKYKSYVSDRIIFCEGYKLKHNPWFKGLPIVPTKGEILSLNINSFSYPNMINNGNWLLPLHDGLYRFGASFEPHREDTATSLKNLELLEKRFKAMITTNSSYELVNHRAGIRPCTQDRMPIIGMHPRYPQIGVFNGFGAKGVMTIPYLAQQFSRYYNIDNSVLSKAQISRFNYDTKNDVFN